MSLRAKRYILQRVSLIKYAGFFSGFFPPTHLMFAQSVDKSMKSPSHIQQDEWCIAAFSIVVEHSLAGFSRTHKLPCIASAVVSGWTMPQYTLANHLQILLLVLFNKKLNGDCPIDDTFFRLEPKFAEKGKLGEELSTRAGSRSIQEGAFLCMAYFWNGTIYIYIAS